LTGTFNVKQSVDWYFDPLQINPTSEHCFHLDVIWCNKYDDTLVTIFTGNLFECPVNKNQMGFFLFNDIIKVSFVNDFIRILHQITSK
jgi:hypothetical protein